MGLDPGERHRLAAGGAHGSGDLPAGLQLEVDLVPSTLDPDLRHTVPVVRMAGHDPGGSRGNAADLVGAAGVGSGAVVCACQLTCRVERLDEDLRSGDRCTVRVGHDTGEPALGAQAQFDLAFLARPQPDGTDILRQLLAADLDRPGPRSDSVEVEAAVTVGPRLMSARIGTPRRSANARVAFKA